MIAMSVLFVLAMLAPHFVSWIMAAKTQQECCTPWNREPVFWLGVLRHSYGRTWTTVFRKTRWAGSPGPGPFGGDLALQ